MDEISTDTAFGGFSLQGDYNEAAQMQPFAQDASLPWWESVIKYGAVRAIDNRFGPVNVAGNTNPGNFAGQNGRTYTNQPIGTGTSAAASASSSNGLLMIALGVLAFAMIGA